MGTVKEILGTILPYISGPVIGAIIGYFTNYLAVKMLFRPYHAKEIFGHRLPFTPGIIPKRQKDLAHAIGRAVEQDLLTETDVEKLLQDETKLKTVAQNITDKVIGTSLTIGQAINILPHEAQEQLKTTVTKKLTEVITVEVQNIGIGMIVAEQGKAYFESKKPSLGFLAMMLNDQVVDAIFGDIQNATEAYVAQNAEKYVTHLVEDKMVALEATDLSHLEDYIDKESLQSAIRNLVYMAMVDVAGHLLQKGDIARIVTEKVETMDVKSLEKLCLSVMKKELNTVVNLGALIGFGIGIINIFV